MYKFYLHLIVKIPSVVVIVVVVSIVVVFVVFSIVVVVGMTQPKDG